MKLGGLPIEVYYVLCKRKYAKLHPFRVNRLPHVCVASPLIILYVDSYGRIQCRWDHDGRKEFSTMQKRWDSLNQLSGESLPFKLSILASEGILSDHR